MFVCSLCTLRSFDGSSPNLVGVCRLTSHLPLRGSFSKRSTGRRVNGSLSLPLYYICASLTPHAATAPFAWQAAESNSAPFAVLHVNDVCRWTWQLLLRGSFSKRSTGRWVNGSNGSTGHFHFHYIIYDSRRRQAHATPLQKSTRRMMTPGSCHSAAKSTQRILLARRVNFLVPGKSSK